MERINQAKSWFLENINKMYKLTDRMIKIKNKIKKA